MKWNRFAWVAAMALMAACGSPQATPASAPVAPQAVPQAAPANSVTAVKPVFIDFYAPW